MGSMSLWHWIIVLAVVMILFGGTSKISNIMGDFAKGIKAFKKGMKDDEVEGAPSQKTINTGSTNEKEKV